MRTDLDLSNVKNGTIIVRLSDPKASIKVDIERNDTAAVVVEKMTAKVLNYLSEALPKESGAQSLCNEIS